jgi:hypothetical protein
MLVSYEELLAKGRSPLESLRRAVLYVYHNSGDLNDLTDRGAPHLRKAGRCPAAVGPRSRTGPASFCPARGGSGDPARGIS